MDREEKYCELISQASAALQDEKDPVVWMASLSCLIRERKGYFWVGFYRVIQGELVIGPYQGTFGCTRISLDRGVCGACAREEKTLIVEDVHRFPGHIACDSRSNSEIVVPVKDEEGKVRAVLDIDSTRLSDFDETDQCYLEKLVQLMKGLEWNT